MYHRRTGFCIKLWLAPLRNPLATFYTWSKPPPLARPGDSRNSASALILLGGAGVVDPFQPRLRGSVERQVHFLQEREEARVAAQAAEIGLDAQQAEPQLAPLIGGLEPLECLVALAAPGVDGGHKVGDVGLVARDFRDQRVERRRGLARVAKVMLGDGDAHQPERPVGQLPGRLQRFRRMALEEVE